MGIGAITLMDYISRRIKMKLGLMSISDRRKIRRVLDEYFFSIN